MFKALKSLKVLAFAAAIVWPTLSSASTIKDVTIESRGKSTVIHIKTDEKLLYDVFDIKTLGKVVLKLKGASFSKLYKKDPSNLFIASSFSKVFNEISFSKSSNDTKLSIDYNEKYAYKVDRVGNFINIYFSKNSANELSEPIVDGVTIKDYSSYSEITIKGKGIENSQERIFLLKNGLNLVVNLNIKNNLPLSSYAYSGQRVDKMIVNSINSKTRLSFSLVNRMDKGYKVEKKKGLLVIKLGGGSPVSGNESKISVNKVLFSAKKEVEYIDVFFSGKSPQVLFENGSKTIKLTVKDAGISVSERGNFDVSEFFGVLSSFSVSLDIKSGGVVILGKLSEKGKFSIVQLPHKIRLILEPEAIAISRGSDISSTDMFKYSGDNVELDYDNASIKNVLKTIAVISGMNFVISDNVKGNITVKLKDVPWDQALDLILRSKGLGKETEGNVLRIAPMKDLKEEYKNRAETISSSKDLEPIVTAFVHLKYKKTLDIKEMFDNIVTSNLKKEADQAAKESAGSNGDARRDGIVSPRGSVMFDNEKNIVIIRDTLSHINNFKRIVSEIDVAPKQVLIEARIVEATDDFSRDLGVSWGGSLNKLNSSGTSGLTLGAAKGVTSGNFGLTNAKRGSVVDLPAAIGLGSGGAIGLSIGTIAGNVLDLELSAAEGEGKVKIVSRPRVLVLDGKEANINQGTDIPFQSSSQNQGTNVQFKKANLGLIVSPLIKGDNEIVMHILVTKDSPGTALVGTNPIISTKQVETDILVNDNETVVIGGIYTTSEESLESKVPFFGDLPMIGNLFKHSKRSKKRTELLVFITPRIMSNN